MVNPDEQQRLLRLARESLVARVMGKPSPPAERGGVLDEPAGAFVTIHSRGELRGCLGRIDTDQPLGDTIVHLGAVVSDQDPRFPPVTPAELPDIDLEISVLTPEREVTSPEEVEVGRHGVIIEQGWHRGLLLPQVAVEHRWDRDTLLSHTCLKAGLPPDAWRHGARILVFEAEVFGEAEVAETKEAAD